MIKENDNRTKRIASVRIYFNNLPNLEIFNVIEFGKLLKESCFGMYVSTN